MSDNRNVKLHPAMIAVKKDPKLALEKIEQADPDIELYEEIIFNACNKIFFIKDDTLFISEDYLQLILKVFELADQKKFSLNLNKASPISTLNLLLSEFKTKANKSTLKSPGFGHNWATLLDSLLSHGADSSELRSYPEKVTAYPEVLLTLLHNNYPPKSDIECIEIASALLNINKDDFLQSFDDEKNFPRNHLGVPYVQYVLPLVYLMLINKSGKSETQSGTSNLKSICWLSLLAHDEETANLSSALSKGSVGLDFEKIKTTFGKKNIETAIERSNLLQALNEMEAKSKGNLFLSNINWQEVYLEIGAYDSAISWVKRHYQLNFNFESTEIGNDKQSADQFTFVDLSHTLSSEDGNANHQTNKPEGLFKLAKIYLHMDQSSELPNSPYKKYAYQCCLLAAKNGHEPSLHLLKEFFAHPKVLNDADAQFQLGKLLLQRNEREAGLMYLQYAINQGYDHLQYLVELCSDKNDFEIVKRLILDQPDSPILNAILETSEQPWSKLLLVEVLYHKDPEMHRDQIIKLTLELLSSDYSDVISFAKEKIANPLTLNVPSVQVALADYYAKKGSYESALYYAELAAKNNALISNNKSLVYKLISILSSINNRDANIIQASLYVLLKDYKQAAYYGFNSTMSPGKEEIDNHRMNFSDKQFELFCDANVRKELKEKDYLMFINLNKNKLCAASPSFIDQLIAETSQEKIISSLRQIQNEPTYLSFMRSYGSQEVGQLIGFASQPKNDIGKLLMVCRLINKSDYKPAPKLALDNLKMGPYASLANEMASLISKPSKKRLALWQKSAGGNLREHIEQFLKNYCDGKKHSFFSPKSLENINHYLKARESARSESSIQEPDIANGDDMRLLIDLLNFRSSELYNAKMDRMLAFLIVQISKELSFKNYSLSNFDSNSNSNSNANYGYNKNA